MRLFALSWVTSIVVILQQAHVPSAAFVVCALLVLFFVGYRWPCLNGAVLGVWVAVFSLLLGFHQFKASQLRLSQVSTDLRLQIHISNVPTRLAGRVRFEATVLGCISCVESFGPKQLRLSWYGGNQSIRAGETWELTVRLKSIHGLRNPGGFDQVRWAITQGLHARGYVRNQPAAIRLGTPAMGSITALRDRLAVGLERFPSASASVGLVQALTLGVKHKVSETSWQVLRATGTAHLLAISGLHVSLLAGWAYVFGRHAVPWFMRRMPGLRRPGKWLEPHSVGLLSSLLVALAYALLAGFELPVQRALIMLLVWGVSSWRFRTLAPSTGLALALIAVLSHNVFSPLSAGFWLSFGTVAVLFYMHLGHLSVGYSGSAINDHQHRAWQRIWPQLRAILKTHGLLGIALLPLSAWFFQSGSLIAPLANLVAVPWVGFIVVPLCFLTLGLSALMPSVAGYALSAAQWSLDVLLLYLGWLVEAVTQPIVLSLPGVLVLLLCLSGVLLSLAPRGIGLRWFAGPLVLPAFLFNIHQAPMDGFEVHVLDVGQGLAVFIFTDDHTLLFDTGGKISNSLSVFEGVVMPFLQAKGRRQIDTVVVSHGDEDHAFGILDVLRHYPDVRLIASDELRGVKSGRIERCEAGMSWSLDNVHFSVLHPAQSDAGSKNNRSCVLLIHMGSSRVLLTGDIEHAGEARLANRMGVFPVDLMTAPHHGSRTSSGDELLTLLQPAHVVFSAGYRNPYGFPHSEVQLRYKLLNARQYLTGTQGAVSFAFDRSGLLRTPATWWQSHRRFWHGFVNPVCSEPDQGQAIVVRQQQLSQIGQTLCGK